MRRLLPLLPLVLSVGAVVLGAGSGWARSILFNDRLREMFAAFFARPDTFSLGVCNGCQMLSQLKDIIPGAEKWPRFVAYVPKRVPFRDGAKRKKKT